MLKKSERQTKDDFKVRKQVLYRVNSGFFSISFSPKRDDSARFAIVIGGSITKNKPKRNTLRRKVYSVISVLKNKGIFMHDIVIYPKKEALNATFDVIMQDIANLTEKSLQKN